MDHWVVPLCLLAAPGYGLIRARGITWDAFVLNGRSTSTLLTLASVICGNVGIGTFVALFLFTAQSPVTGYVIALAYTAGLVLRGAMARTIHDVSRRTRTEGLVDWLTVAHGMGRP